MIILTTLTEAGATASVSGFATSLNTASLSYNGQLAHASRHLIRHLHLLPIIAPTVAALAGLGGGA